MLRLGRGASKPNARSGRDPTLERDPELKARATPLNGGALPWAQSS
jgi:hypothetical protein